MRWAFALAIILLVQGVSGQSDEDIVLTAEERAWLEAHGPIRFAPDPAYAPFEWLDDEGAHGINIDFLNRMSRNLGFEYEVVRYDSWGEVLEAKQRGDVDLLGSLARNEEREVYMDFYGPYAQVGEVFYIRDDSPATSPEDLVGMDVGVISGYAAASWLAENMPELTLVEVPDMQTGLDRLAIGELDAFFENVPVGGYTIRENAFNNIKIMGEPLYYSDANWGYTKGEVVLGSIIEKGMASISLGEQARIFEFWTGYDLGVVSRQPAGLSPAAQIGFIVVAVVAAGAILWGVVLRGTVVRREGEVRSTSEALEASSENLAGELQRRKDAEQKVKALNDQLADELAKKGEKLSNVMGELDAVASALIDQLRAPLERARVGVEKLHRQNAGVLGVAGARDIERVVEEIEKATAAVDGLANAARRD